MANTKWAQVIQYRIFYKPEFKPTVNILTNERGWINIKVNDDIQFLSVVSVLNGRGNTFYDLDSGFLLTGEGAHPTPDNIISVPPPNI